MAGSGNRWTRADQQEWDRMNSENSQASQGSSNTGNGSAATTSGNTGRGQSNSR